MEPTPADGIVRRLKRLEAERDAAYAKGVEEGIGRVKAEPISMVAYPSRLIVDEACSRALAAFRKEQADGA
jgi:hypothetical protein